MPIPFSLIPQHLQIEIVQKQTVRDFLDFYIASRECHEISLQCKSKLHMNVDTPVCLLYDNGYYIQSEFGRLRRTAARKPSSKLPVRIVFQKVFVPTLSESSIYWLTDYFLFTSSEINQLKVINFICSAEQLNGLFGAASVAHFECQSIIPTSVLRIPAMENLRQLTIKNNNLSDDDFLAMKIPFLFVGLVSGFAINSFLKEWKEGYRTFTNISLAIAPGSRISDVFLGLDYETGSLTQTMEEYYLRDQGNNRVSIAHFPEGGGLAIKHL